METLKIYAYNGYIIIVALKEDLAQKDRFLIVNGSGTICKVQNSLGEAMAEIKDQPPTNVEFKDEIPKTLIDHADQEFFIIASFEDQEKKPYSVVDQLGISQPEPFSTVMEAREEISELVKSNKKSIYHP